MESKTVKIFFVLHITGFAEGTAYSHNLEQDACNRESMC